MKKIFPKNKNFFYGTQNVISLNVNYYEENKMSALRQIASMGKVVSVNQLLARIH